MKSSLLLVCIVYFYIHSFDIQTYFIVCFRSPLFIYTFHSLMPADDSDVSVLFKIRTNVFPFVNICPSVSFFSPVLLKFYSCFISHLSLCQLWRKKIQHDMLNPFSGHICITAIFVVLLYYIVSLMCRYVQITSRIKIRLNGMKWIN